MSQMHDIPFAKPSITSREVENVTIAAQSGWGSRCYEHITTFENEFCSYLGSKYAIATSSCTGALHLALRSIGIQQDDEVIVPEVTWIASVAPVVYQCAKPVLVDINPNSWCIDPEQVIKAITPRTKAIIAVHLYGNMCNIEELSSIAKSHNLLLIEDSAEALGSSFKGKMAGSFGDIGVFSFHGTKTITTGEGGMFVTSNQDLYAKAVIQSNHGRQASKHSMFWMDEIGLKYKMSNIQAALGVAQLSRIQELLNRKREIFAYYHDQLNDLPISMNPEPHGFFNSYWLPAVVFHNNITEEMRDLVISQAQSIGIGLRPFFYPLTRFPMFASCVKGLFSAKISQCGINLPSFHDMTLEQQDIVIQYIRDHLA